MQKKSFITCLLKEKKTIIMLRNKGFKANMYSFKDSTKSRNKLRVFKGKGNIKSEYKLALSLLYLLLVPSKVKVK
jgi:hypothetical protein